MHPFGSLKVIITMTKVLIVEDEKSLSESIRFYLQNESLTCDVANDFYSAIEKTGLYEYACIILDIMLPGGSGLDILKELKKANSTTGILIISAKNSINDKVNGLNIGADDYLAKPFHLAELKARVEAIIRRKSFDGKNEIIFDKLILNIDDRILKTGNQYIELTKKEYDLLVYFIANKNKVVTKEAIVQYLWGNETEMAVNYDFIYTHIKNVRKKIMEAGCPDYIKAVYGMGYKFCLR
jgi:DNA-binding response OmpR family regulator